MHGRMTFGARDHDALSGRIKGGQGLGLDEESIHAFATEAVG